jgi:hypothetical protein
LFAGVAALVGLLAFTWKSHPEPIPAPDTFSEQLCAQYEHASAPTRVVLEVFGRHVSGEPAQYWDDELARLAVALYGALERETTMLGPSTTRKPPLAQRSPVLVQKEIAYLVDSDRKLSGAIKVDSPPLYALTVFQGNKFSRDGIETLCATTRSFDSILEQERRDCETRREHSIANWWTVRCVWDQTRV